MRVDSRPTSAIMPSIVVASRKKNRGIIYSSLFLAIILLVLGFTFSESAAQCVTPPSGLVSWWRAENDANDFTGSNRGTLQNGATFAAGKVGQAFSFDGVDDYTSVLDDISLQLPDNQFAISLWFKTASVASSQMILSKGVSDANEEYSINLVGNAGIYWDYGDLQSFVFTSPVIVVPNQWYHLVVLYSSSFSPRGKVYLNSRP